MTTQSDQLREAIAACESRSGEVTAEKQILENQVTELKDKQQQLIRESGNSPAQRLLSRRSKYYKKPDPFPREEVGEIEERIKELNAHIADNSSLLSSLSAEKRDYIEEIRAAASYDSSKGGIGRRRIIAQWGNR